MNTSAILGNQELMDLEAALPGEIGRHNHSGAGSEVPSYFPVASRRIILGVDPGASGAIAFFDPAQPEWIIVHDTPVADREVDAAGLARLIRASGATEAVVERVSAMPKQGVSSTFRFGMAYGAVLATVGVLGLPLRQETPRRWKGHFRLTSDKEQARALAIRLWPGSPDFARKKDHGRAEAALLARFAAEVVR